MRKPYSLFLHNYEFLSGGIKVMYALYGSLLLKGEEVVDKGIFNNPNFVAIYPEIVHENPLRADKVVRYLLNKLGVMSSGGIPGPMHFMGTDEIFVFSKMFAPDTPEDHLMFLPAINTKVFFDKKGTRTKNAVFVGKGLSSMMTIHHPDDCIVINGETVKDQEGLANLLNECQCLYTYDPVSAMGDIARLCGTRVAYLSDEYTRKDYDLYECGTNGMTFKGETTHELDSEAFWDTYRGLQDKFWNESLPNFISITQSL